MGGLGFSTCVRKYVLIYCNFFFQNHKIIPILFDYVAAVKYI